MLCEQMSVYTIMNLSAVVMMLYPQRKPPDSNGK